MNSLKPSAFFELAHFKHASIFEEIEFVWEAIPKIKKYLQEQHLGNIQTSVPQGTFLINPELISIGKGTVIEPGAYIKGPCVIGDNCTIRHGAYIRGDFLAGDDCVIGHDTEVKNSIMFNHANAAHFAYLGEAILGNHVNLGAGTKCANLKLNHAEISLHFNDQWIKTGMKKFGAIIGDYSQIGCNSVSNPGTLIGQKVYVYPCVNFGGVIPSGKTVKSSAVSVVH